MLCRNLPNIVGHFSLVKSSHFLPQEMLRIFSTNKGVRCTKICLNNFRTLSTNKGTTKKIST